MNIKAFLAIDLETPGVSLTALMSLNMSLCGPLLCFVKLLCLTGVLVYIVENVQVLSNQTANQTYTNRYGLQIEKN